jgi:hypothetical protein
MTLSFRKATQALLLPASLLAMTLSTAGPVLSLSPPDSASDPLAPIIVGPREAVGKPGIGQKAAASAIGGVLGSVLGGGGSKSSQPGTRRDPSRKLQYLGAAAASPETLTVARAQWQEDGGLLVSSRIEDSPGKGTFQTVYLERCDGRRLYPQRYEIYDLWNESSVSVSWSKASTSNGQVVSQQSGSFSEGWSDDVPGIGGSGEPATTPGVWQQLGFDRAQSGVRQLGTYFSLTPADLQTLGAAALVVHTTRPMQDPVDTAPALWVLALGNDHQPHLGIAGGQQGWQRDTPACDAQAGLLVASAAALPLVVAASGSGSGSGNAGLPLPAGVEVLSAKGTGRTTGHVISLVAVNTGSVPVSLPPATFYIPSSGQYQSYVGRIAPGTVIGPGDTQTIPVTGYCADVRRPPVPDGVDAPPISTWHMPEGPVGNINIPDRAGALPGGRALIPGTRVALPRAISGDQEPALAAPLLVAALAEIERKTAELQSQGKLQTPFSGNPEREREAVVQQTFWLYAAELEGKDYDKEDFTERLEQQYQSRSGQPIAAATPEEREKLQQGADDFWYSFELVGVEAKVLASDVTPAPATAAKPAEGAAPVAAAEPVHASCPFNRDIKHSPRLVQVMAADSYGDDDSRKKIADGIKAAVESRDNTYQASTPPATAYALWRDDAVGGNSSAYAKSVFLENNQQDWVWTTDPLKAEAGGSGTHTLAFNPGPGCKAVVAGAGLMWIKSSSEAFDPLEDTIKYFRGLEAVKELSVKYVTRKLPPGLDDAIEAGVEAITDPASDTYAAASGKATLVVGGKSDAGASANRVVYKREDTEDKAIIGGGATVKKLFAADVRPNQLTSRIEASTLLEAGATGNGFAKAYLESLFGTLLVGVCECPDGTSVRVLTDAQMFIRSEAATGAAEVALRDMQAVADRIQRDIEGGGQDTGRGALKSRVEAELRKWGDGTAGERFKPAEPKAPAKK